jgi:hypothetical protein
LSVAVHGGRVHGDEDGTAGIHRQLHPWNKKEQSPVNKVSKEILIDFLGRTLVYWVSEGMSSFHCSSELIGEERRIKSTYMYSISTNNLELASLSTKTEHLPSPLGVASDAKAVLTMH